MTETYALWGTGELSPESAKALLEEYIADQVGTVYRPERVTRDQRGLRTALDWFESPEFLGDGGAMPSTDLVQSLLFERDTHGDDVYLLALWPAEPTHEDFDFVESVLAAGIKVFDLSRALDELDLSLYSRPEPTKEEKAEARKVAREQKKLSDAAPKREHPEHPVAGPSVEKMEEIIAGLPDEKRPAPEPFGGQPQEAEPAPAPEPDISVELLAYANAAANLMGALDAFVEAKVNWLLAQRAAEAAPAPEPVEEERPPFDPPYVGTDTKPYYMSKAGVYRPATGKPRRGEIAVNLTDDEARGHGLTVDEPLPF